MSSRTGEPHAIPMAIERSLRSARRAHSPVGFLYVVMTSVERARRVLGASVAEGLRAAVVARLEEVALSRDGGSLAADDEDALVMLPCASFVDASEAAELLKADLESRTVEVAPGALLTQTVLTSCAVSFGHETASNVLRRLRSGIPRPRS